MISRRTNNLLKRSIALIPLSILIVERVAWTINNHSVTDVALRTPASVVEAEKLSIPGDLHVSNRYDGALHKSAAEETNGTIASAFRISQSQRDHQQRPIPLDKLLHEDGAQVECGEGLILMQGKHLPYEELFSGNRKIPRIVHQTSRSYCLTNAVAQVAVHWSSMGHDWAYYFHSDSAVDRLFAQDWPEFPHLSAVLACLDGKGTLKADLWRYLALWEYGGVYADVDTKPNKFNATTITAEDDGFFIVEQYHLLSQYFMAMSPRHPLMFYTIQHVLSSLLQIQDTGMIRAPHVTGPHALHRGFQAFRWDVGVRVPDAVPGEKPAKAGVWTGTDQHNITVCGVGENENEYVYREFIRRKKKIKEYETMGMTHFAGDMARSDRSCMQTLWQEQQLLTKTRGPLR